MIAFLIPGSSVVLKNPEFNDATDVSPKAKVDVMMSGRLRSYKYTPSNVKLTLEFKEVTRAKTMELKAFMGLAVGVSVQYVDYNGNNWRGKFLTKDFDIVTPSRGPGDPSMRQEANSFTLEFEGVQL